MFGKGNDVVTSARQLISKSAYFLIWNPRQFVIFLVVALLLSTLGTSLVTYRGEFLALASQYFPQYFEHRHAFSPRFAYLLPAIVVLAFVTYLYLITAIVLCVRLDSSLIDDRDTPFWPAVRRSVWQVPRATILFALLTGLIGVGLLFLVLPGIYLLIRTFVSVPALVIDAHSPISAIRESWDRTRGRELQIAAVLTVYLVVASVLRLLPIGGYVLAVAVVAPITIATSVLLYRRDSLREPGASADRFAVSS